MSTPKYDKEFKRTAIELVKTTGKSPKQISKELGISDSALYSWIKAYEKDSNPEFPGKGNVGSEKKEVIALQKQLADAKEEIEILKKAMAYFVSPRK